MTPNALARLHLAANTVDRAWSAKEFKDLLGSPLVFLIAHDSCICLARLVADEAEILTIATHPDAQGKGYANQAVRAFEREAAAKGAITAYLEVAEDNVAARAIYKGNGYAISGRRTGYYKRKNGEKVDALVMSKALTIG